MVMLMRRRGVLIAALIAVVVLSAGAALLLRHKPQATSRTGGAGTPPAAAITTIQRLTSANAATQRSVLTPELNSVLPSGRLFPVGTRFTAGPGSWHRSGVFANVTGTIHTSGHAPVRVEIGLVLRRGHWLVTFEEQL
jgi:hypothetical protein